MATDVTASTIAMEEDKRDEDRKKSTIDLAKLEADVAALKALGTGKLSQALEGLLNLEKNCRLAEDAIATKVCCTAICDMCFQARDWKALEENIVALAKKRSQLRQVIQAFVRQAMSYLPQTPDKDTRISLIKTLMSVTEGKIFVEIERARLTRRLAAIREAEGNVSEAAEILQEVAVETFGALAKTEKIDFILEQVRLCLDKQDYIRAQILARKISPRAFVERKGEGKGEIGIEGTTIEAPDEGIAPLPQLKIKYYELMIRYHGHYNNYLEMCRCYRSMYESEGVTGDHSRWKPVLARICWFAVLAPSYSTEAGSSSDALTLLTSTLADKRLSELPSYKALLTSFSTREVLRWTSFSATYTAEMAEASDVFGGASGPQRLADLRLRVTEHNVLVVAKYYSQITMPRLAQLLDMSVDEAEKHVADLVVAKAISAKVDRPAGIVRFGKRQAAEDTLNTWASNIGKLLDLVEKSCQQISKEAMLHKVSITAAGVAPAAGGGGAQTAAAAQ